MLIFSISNLFFFSIQQPGHNLRPMAVVNWCVLHRLTAVPHSFFCRVVPSGHIWSRSGVRGGTPEVHAVESSTLHHRCTEQMLQCLSFSSVSLDCRVIFAGERWMPLHSWFSGQNLGWAGNCHSLAEGRHPAVFDEGFHHSVRQAWKVLCLSTSSFGKSVCSLIPGYSTVCWYPLKHCGTFMKL